VNANTNPAVVADDVVVSLKYVLTVDGQVVDSADENEPIEFIQGLGGIIPGLERELYGMKVGEAKSVTVKPQDGYGEVDPNAVMDVPRSEFPAEIPLKVGVQLQVRDEDGDVMDAQIVAVAKDKVRLDFNHPLAGKTLNFEITVVGLRAASEEELEHGHAHGEDFEGDEFEDDEEDFELYDFDEDDDEDDDEEESNNGKK